MFFRFFFFYVKKNFDFSDFSIFRRKVSISQPKFSCNLTKLPSSGRAAQIHSDDPRHRLVERPPSRRLAGIRPTARGRGRRRDRAAPANGRAYTTSLVTYFAAASANRRPASIQFGSEMPSRQFPPMKNPGADASTAVTTSLKR